MLYNRNDKLVQKSFCNYKTKLYFWSTKLLVDQLSRNNPAIKPVQHMKQKIIKPPSVLSKSSGIQYTPVVFHYSPTGKIHTDTTNNLT